MHESEAAADYAVSGEHLVETRMEGIDGPLGLGQDDGGRNQS
jgi:hypothetical protein